MNSSHRFIVAVLFVVISGILGVITAPDLPDQLVIHWNATGEPDGTMAKTTALAFIPILSTVLLALFASLPRIGPLGENIESFRPVYDWFVVVFTAFMAALHGGILAFNLGYEFDFTLFVLAAVSLLFYYAGVLLSQAKRNWFIGIRTPWTLSSDEVWDRTNHLGSRLFKLTAVVALLGLLFGEYAVYFLIVPAILTAGITVVYSYYLYEQLEPGSDSDMESNH